MIVTITGYKGGIGKTTTAVHLAAVLQQQAPTVLVDGDLNRSATGWARNGFLPFRVADERQAAKVGREFEHIVIDTAARPIREDLEALVTGCDHLIIPTSPDALALDALIQTLGALDALGATNYAMRVRGRRRRMNGEQGRVLQPDSARAPFGRRRIMEGGRDAFTETLPPHCRGGARSTAMKISYVNKRPAGAPAEVPEALDRAEVPFSAIS